jgi:hypothetical protein
MRPTKAHSYKKKISFLAVVVSEKMLKEKLTPHADA